MKKILTFLTLLLVLRNGYSKNIVTIVHDTIKVSDNSKELELYKMLYLNAKDASNANYTVLFTVIAVVVGFILFILGSQVFFNYRLNKQDLDSLKSELKLGFSTDLHKSEIKAQKMQLELVNKISNSIKEADNAVEATKKSVNQRIDIINSSLNILMAKDYKSNGSHEAALIHYIWACTSSLKAGLKKSLRVSLDKLKEFLYTLSEMSDFSIDNIQKLLVDTNEKYSGEFDSILSEIKNEISNKSVTKLE